MKFKTVFLLVVILCLMTAITMLALPESPTGLNITWWSTDGGGGTSKGSTFSLSGTAGQTDAGRMTGGSYSLTGGFWNGQTGGIGGGQTLKVYLPFVRK